MVAHEKPLFTLADLRDIESRPENAHKHFELLRGEIFENPPSCPLNGYIASYCAYQLYAFVQPPRGGLVFGDNTSYELPNGDELIPDVSFITKEKAVWPLPEKFRFAPDLAVEVFSPSNHEREMTEKVESFLESGTQLVWVIYPTKQVVEVYRRLDDGSLNLRKVDVNGTLDGETVLPGFQLPVRGIFPAE
jgi:Uma2 family endonuclease